MVYIVTDLPPNHISYPIPFFPFSPLFSLIINFNEKVCVTDEQCSKATWFLSIVFAKAFTESMVLSFFVKTFLIDTFH